ncbi:GNAT family N-acetyltransferase [Paenibacillus xanthanilyticus]|uniref:GNAT family N-acetyltransferase n=1 Tax=Paenibacillus xanthanilyticus TaxID=1783531 RepID=A0ABV8JZJ4_9BACL
MVGDARISTREATWGDESFRFRVYESTRQSEFASLGWEPAQLEAFLRMQFEMQQRSYAMQYPGSGYQVVLLDREPVGHFMTVETSNRLLLADIALMAPYRGGGIGSALIRRLQHAAAAKALPLELRVVASNPAAGLYVRLGFRAVEEQGLHVLMRWVQEEDDGFV